MIKNSALIYIIDTQTVYAPVAIEQALGIKVYTGSQNDLDAIKKAALSIHYRFGKDEPSDKLLERYMKILIEQRKERIALQKGRRFTRITHSQLCLENASHLAEKLSRTIGVPIISLADFDQSVFQMCLYLNGKLKTMHQIGEELTDMGLSEQHADISEIARVLNSEEQVIKKIIDDNNIWDVEDDIIALIEEIT